MIQTFTPHPSLQPYIRQFVYTEMGKEGQWTRAEMMPPGYTALIVVLEKDRHLICVNNKYQHCCSSPTFSGQITRFSDIRLYGRLKLFFAAFQPCGAFRLLGIPQQDCTGKSFPLSALLGTEGKLLSAQLNNLSDPQRVYDLLQQFLLQRLHHNKPSPICEQLLHVSEQIKQQCHTSGLIERICKQEGYSISKLERHMNKIVGMGPKKFQRIMRFNNAMHYIKQNDYKCHWARLAYQFGYYDQMHFIRECKTFYGKTPTALKRENGLMDVVHA